MLLLIFALACGPAPSLETGAPRDSDPPHDSAPDTDSGRDSAVDSAQDSAPDGDSAPDTAPEDTGPSTWRSALYPVDWTPAYTGPGGAFLHDFSYAGYHASEIELPIVTGPVVSVLGHGADATGASDSTSAIQAAIYAAEALAATEGRAVVSLPAGTYRVDGQLRVNGAGVVVRGAGAGATFVRFTKAVGMSDQAHLTFAGALSEGADHPLVADGDARDMVVEVSDATGLAVGDTLHVGWTISDDFVADHGMTDVWYSFNGSWRAFFRRTVVAVDTSVTPHRVTLDVPLRYPARTRDGASLRRASGYLTEVGLEDLSVSTVATWSQAWDETRTHAVLFSGVADGWIRGVSSFGPDDAPDLLGDHLMSGGIKVLDSRRVTVADVRMEEAQNRGTGGNGYLVEVSRSGEVLVRDTVARAGRHNFIQNWDFGTSGCVFLRTESSDGRSYVADWDPLGYESWSEYHHSLAIANLVDQSVADDGWQGVNRQGESSGAGQSATQDVFWNTSGGGTLRSLQFGLGYVIGTDGLTVMTDPDAWDWNNSGEGTAPEDWVEGVDEGALLEPASLFEDQLARRLADRR